MRHVTDSAKVIPRKIEKLFSDFKKINDICSNDLVEISVKQHQITLMFDTSLLYFSGIEKLPYLSNGFITTFGDNLFITIEVTESTKEIYKEEYYKNFFDVIRIFAEKICQCPSLEYVVSNQYIKCFLDKTNLTVNDLKTYEDVLGAEGQLELHPQRAYLLFINTEGEV